MTKSPRTLTHRRLIHNLGIIRSHTRTRGPFGSPYLEQAEEPSCQDSPFRIFINVFSCISAFLVLAAPGFVILSEMMASRRSVHVQPDYGYAASTAEAPSSSRRYEVIRSSGNCATS